jgi:hypothetical protein
MNGASVHLHWGVEGRPPMACSATVERLGTWAVTRKIPGKRFWTVEMVWGRIDNGMWENLFTIIKQRFGF